MKLVHPHSLHNTNPGKSHRIILDVLPGDTFEKRHIKNALNVCAYELDFIKKAKALIPEKNLWNFKYGSGKIYEALGKHVVNDLISISFQLIAPLR